MAFCTECGHQLADGAKFCYECGAKVNAPSSPRVEQRKTVYDGEIRKCPSCGDLLDAFEVRCKMCGYELRGTKGTTSAQELAAKLEEIEKARPVGNPNFIQAITAHTVVNKTDAQKITVIKNFPIPNTKEDLCEFLVLAASNINLQRYENSNSLSETDRALSDAWEVKFKQAYEKARILLVGYPDFQQIQDVYERNYRKIERIQKKSKWTETIGWIFIGVVSLVFYVFVFSNLFTS